MGKLEKVKLPKSKRLRVTLFAFIVNAILYYYGMYRGADLTALGAGLAFINAPIMAYLGAESYKPSDKNKINPNGEKG
tara:strand:+ start:96 stop:329 length:234 start_codon:yes stop_codon:yes gene_type:complete